MNQARPPHHDQFPTPRNGCESQCPVPRAASGAHPRYVENPEPRISAFLWRTGDLWMSSTQPADGADSGCPFNRGPPSRIGFGDFVESRLSAVTCLVMVRR